MTIKEAYIHLQQGLQNIAAFVNKNVEVEELDYFWKQGTYKFIELCFPNKDDDENPINRNEEYEEIQASIDDLRVLEVLGASLTLTSFTTGGYSGKKGDLPSNYQHLLNDRTIVKALCSETETREVSNRLIRSQASPNLLDNNLYKTSVISPVSRFSGNTIYVYNTYKGTIQFNIENVLFDYIKKPANITYGADGSAVIEFPEHVCFKIIKTVLIYIAAITEQSLQKIQLIDKLA